MNLLERITINPEQCGGRPCIRGMRIRVMDVLDLLAAGLSTEQVLEELPDLEREDVQAVLQYAARLMHLEIALNETVPMPVFASIGAGESDLNGADSETWLRENWK
jgi:uncharacterized protein (DUF433 family)